MNSNQPESKIHIDQNEWATTRLHKTHLCEKCKHEWRPFEYYTIGCKL